MPSVQCGVRSLQIGAIELLRAQPGLQETEGCLRVEVNSRLEDTPLRLEHPDASDGAELEVALAPFVLHDIADDSSRTAIESGHVDPGQVHPPVVDGMRDHPARVADGDVGAERADSRSRTERVSSGGLERRPFVGEDVGTLAQAVPLTEAYRRADVVDGAAGGESFGAREEPGPLGDLAQ